jgi:hypothetical protein
MHRSGTSLLARMLSLMGADLPANLAGPNHANETGYWESLDINAIHEEIFNSLSLSWYELAKFPDSWHKSTAAAAFRQKMLQLLHRDFPASRLFLIKDPRMSRFVPFWIDVLKEFGARPVFVIAVRNPLEVTDSLGRLYPLLPQQAMLLWLRYMLDAEQHTRGLTRCFISYDDLLSDWSAAVNRISHRTGIQWPRTTAEAKREVEAVSSDRYRHYRAASSALESNASVVSWIKDFYAALSAVSRDATTDIGPLCDQIRKLFEDANLMYGPLLAERQGSAEEAAQLRKELAAVKATAESSQRAAAELHRQLQSRQNELEQFQSKRV